MAPHGTHDHAVMHRKLKVYPDAPTLTHSSARMGIRRMKMPRRQRVVIELPSEDPDARILLAWLARVPRAARAFLLRRMVVLGLQLTCRRLRRLPTRPTPHPVTQPAPPPPSPLPAVSLTHLAHRLRIPLCTGGHAYEHNEHDRTC